MPVRQPQPCVMFSLRKIRSVLALRHIRVMHVGRRRSSRHICSALTEQLRSGQSALLSEIPDAFPGHELQPGDGDHAVLKNTGGMAWPIGVLEEHDVTGGKPSGLPARLDLNDAGQQHLELTTRSGVRGIEPAGIEANEQVSNRRNGSGDIYRRCWWSEVSERERHLDIVEPRAPGRVAIEPGELHRVMIA